MELKPRTIYTFIEDKVEEAGQYAEIPLRKVAVAAVLKNPYAGKYIEQLQPLIDLSVGLGAELSNAAVQALAPYKAQSYGKAGVVGIAGEQEHANALLTTTFANPLRDAVGGGKAWISSFTKRAAPGATIDIPLACKDALYVRSHYDGMTITLHDAPQPDEVVIILCLANRGRLNARVGGLKFEDVKGQDGLT